MDAGIVPTIYDLKDYLKNVFATKQQEISSNDTPLVTTKRAKAFELFNKAGFPHAALERWRGTDLSRALNHDYQALPEPPSDNLDIDKIFKCDVPYFETLLVSQLNGWYTDRKNLIQVFPNGMVIGSLAAAFHKYPELIQAHYGQYADDSSESLTALNTAMAQDGVFIYVPDNVTVEQNVQMVNITDFKQNLFLNTRNLVILGENSHLRLVQCDDSINHDISFINTVTEVKIGRNSTLDHYKLQNKDDHTTMINSMYFHQDEGSSLSTNAISLNGGLIRNLSHITMSGSHSSAEVCGLYLMDRYQHIDNQVYINHVAPECESRELFKGVLDDHASGVFNGHIKVHRDAQKTNAFQTNKNILLSDKASIDTKPFLEIYADDVKCSHGATIGQLDAEALFYIRSRGISESNAKILLMYAFAAEVINKISIPELRLRMDDMVKKRLRGELSQCEQCVLNCSSHEMQKVEFNIDMSKI
ncbi:MAG: Fe-S cluster assembly protein SufD [Lentimicrobiaceae bacterium]|jgi:Fe-S cluster assembly protein SufD